MATVHRWRYAFPLLLAVSALAQDMTVVKPKETHEVLNNPGIGFTTFQRFNGDALNEGNVWPEGFPIEYDALAAKGKAKRAFPETTIAYFRIYWRFLEPEKGKYNWDLIDRALKTAHENGQTLMLRFPPYGPKDESDVPAWYRAEAHEPLDKNRPAADWNSKTAKWMVNPENPAYAGNYGRLVRAIGARYDGNPDLELIDIGLVGAWGEGAGSELLSESTRRALVDAYTQSFHHTPLVTQLQDVRTVGYTMAQARTTRDDTSKPLIGWRADCLGDMGGFSKTFSHMLDYYPEKILELQLSDAWKLAPVSMESCWVMQTWKDKGWDIDYIMDKAIQWHVSSFNNKASAVPAELWPKVNAWLERMGYRFVVDRFEYQSAVDASRKLDFNVLITNKGNAPVYRPYTLAIRLKGPGGESILPTSAPIEDWLPGDHMYEDAVFLPWNLPDGKYDLAIAMVGSHTQTPRIKLAIEGRDSDGWYPMGQVEVHTH
jgi:hypothetical protein